MPKMTRHLGVLAVATALATPVLAGAEPSERLVAASRLQEAGNHREAIALLEQIREIDPRNVQVLYGLALSLYSVGEYREAAHVGETLLAEEPNSPADLYIIVGGAYNRLRDWKKSEEITREGLDAWPDVPSLQLQHVISLEGLGRIEEAIVELERSIARSPYEASLWRAMGDALSATGAPGALVRRVRALADTRERPGPRKAGRRRALAGALQGGRRSVGVGRLGESGGEGARAARRLATRRVVGREPPTPGSSPTRWIPRCGWSRPSTDARRPICSGDRSSSTTSTRFEPRVTWKLWPTRCAARPGIRRWSAGARKTASSSRPSEAGRSAGPCTGRRTPRVPGTHSESSGLVDSATWPTKSRSRENVPAIRARS